MMQERNTKKESKCKTDQKEGKITCSLFLRKQKLLAACMQFRQKLANFAVFVARHFFDGITSYNLESMTERKWLRRILFLETVAGKAFLGLKDEP